MAAKAKTKPKSKAKPAKAKAKRKASKPAAKRSAKTARERHRGRRPEPAPKIKKAHLKAIKDQRDQLKKDEKALAKGKGAIEDLKADVQESKNELARLIDAAQADGVSTKEIAETIEKSRQTVFKLVAERVDGKKLNPTKAELGTSTRGKAKVKAPASKPKAQTKTAKAKVTPKAKAPKAKPKASKKSAPVKAKPKAKAVISGRNADIASMGKGKAKPARKRLRPRPKVAA